MAVLLLRDPELDLSFLLPLPVGSAHRGEHGAAATRGGRRKASAPLQTPSPWTRARAAGDAAELRL